MRASTVKRILKEKITFNIYIYLGFTAFYLIAYRDVLFEQSLFWALNLIPLPTSNSRFYIPGQFYWYPGNLGCPAQPNIANWLPYIFVLISGRNLILAEKLLTSTTLVSCFTMYFFLSNHFGGSRLAHFSAALIYGFGPATVLNFADILHWGYAIIPVVFNYMFNILKGSRRIKDVLILGLSLSFMVAFLPQVLSLIFLSFLIFLVVHILSRADKSKYFRKVAVSFSLALLTFVATSPYLVSGAYQLMVIIGWIPPLDFITPPNLPSRSQPSLYFATYSNQEIANTIRLIGGSTGNHLPEGSWIGFVLPIFAFTSLLLVRRGEEMLNLLALALVSLVTITIIYGIHLRVGWAMWLIYNTPISLFHYPERPLYIVTFAYSVMISVTIERLINYISYFHISGRFILVYLRYILMTFLVVSLLASVFAFAPVFDVQIHQERYHPLPPVYFSIQNWMSSRKIGMGEYRVMFLPTDHFSTILGISDSFEVTPGYALYYTQKYVNSVYNELVSGKLYNLGSLLAPASVKYIILATPNASTLWPGSSAQPAPLSPTWDLQGEPRYYTYVLQPYMVQGDPTKIAKILDSQMDLKLVYVSDDFRVYENKKYIPKVSVFSNAIYVVGSESALSILPSLPGFNISRVLPIFAYQNPNLSENLSCASSSIVFFNSDINDLQKLCSKAVNIITDKKQVYLFSQNSSTFTRLMRTSSGQYYIAIMVPKPVTVDQSMSIIDLDSAQKFIISRKNFKPAHNPPDWDFDNANYYFVTTIGGWISVSFKGSAQVWAYIGYNSTLSNIGSQTPYYFSWPIENRTFDIYLPPNTSFQLIVNAYNPTLGQNIPDNLSEIIIEHKIGGEYSILNLDGINISYTPTSRKGEWEVFGPIYFDSGTHNLTITNGIRRDLIAIYNTADLAEIFESSNVDYKFSKLSETSYNINFSTARPVFIVLSESYYPNWFAYSDGRKLIHFVAFSYSNGFYINRTRSGGLSVKIEYEPPFLNYVYVAQQILFATISLLLIASSIVRRIKHK